MDIQFKRPELEDREFINTYLKQQKTRSCEFTFANIYLWSRHYNLSFAEINHTLVFRQEGKQLLLTLPFGQEQYIKQTIEILFNYAEELGKEIAFYSVTPEQYDFLNSLFPDLFQIEYNRDAADYVYETEKLAALSGKKYHGKKNHVNKFKSLYPDWSYEKIDTSNVEECFQMAMQWRKDNACDTDEEKRAELCVALNSLRLLKELCLYGGCIRVNGNIAAFSIGEPVNDDTMVVHIEKALTEYEGAYTIMNQQFVLHEAMDYIYVNREEDMGVEGLRKAKLSYRPVFLIEKGISTIKKRISNN